jgi:arylamine N-acetyltransferase
VEDEEELVLQTAAESGWSDVYGFVPKPVPRVDAETSRWFTSTHPRSPLVTGLIATIHRQDGTRISLSDRGELAFTDQSPESIVSAPIQRLAG